VDGLPVEWPNAGATVLESSRHALRQAAHREKRSVETEGRACVRPRQGVDRSHGTGSHRISVLHRRYDYPSSPALAETNFGYHVLAEVELALGDSGMQVQRAIMALTDLACSPSSVSTWATASVLLDGLERLQTKSFNWTAKEILQSARSWFEIKCVFGEAGQWKGEDLEQFILQDLSTVAHEIADHGLGFKPWH
jgi:hypothetical protein